MYIAYPMWVTRGDESRLVQNEVEFLALDEGWVAPVAPVIVKREDMPDFQDYPKWVNGKLIARIEDDDSEEARTRERLLEMATERGVKIDKRWSDDRLRAAVEAAE